MWQVHADRRQVVDRGAEPDRRQTDRSLTGRTSILPTRAGGIPMLTPDSGS